MNNLSLSTEQRSVSDYETDESRFQQGVIGKGAFSFVKLVKEKSSGQRFAMKMISKAELLDKSSILQMKQEIKIHRKLNHPHIIKLQNYLEDKYFIYMVLEYAENGTLFNYLKKRGKLTENEAFVFFFQTCLGLDYLHKNDVMHRDLKPENLLLDSKGNIKLCDFGWSTENIGFKKQTFCGTLNYMAPEVLQNCEYNYKVDMWGLGIILYEMLHGSPPDAYKFTLSKNTIEISPDISPEARNLIKNLLRMDPKDRPSMEEVLRDPWMLLFEKQYGMKIESFVSKKKKQSSKYWEIKDSCTRSLNEYNLNFLKLEKIEKKNVQEAGSSNKDFNLIDRFFSAIGCVKRDKNLIKKRNIT